MTDNTALNDQISATERLLAAIGTSWLTSVTRYREKLALQSALKRLQELREAEHCRALAG